VSVARAATVDTGAVYEQVRAQFAAFAIAATAEELAAPVAAAPGWVVRDLLGHVVGLTADLNAARFPEPGDTDGSGWTGRQAAERRALPIADVLAEWDREAAQFTDGLRTFGYEMGSHFTADLLVHLHDAQAALGRGPYADPLALDVALDHYTDYLHQRFVEAGWGSVRVEAGGDTWTLGDGPVVAAVSGAAYDVLRSLCARRSAAQIRRLSWTGDVDGFLATLTTVLYG
jgi:uncharacterized protein (TIGR03083 family)